MNKYPTFVKPTRTRNNLIEADDKIKFEFKDVSNEKNTLLHQDLTSEERIYFNYLLWDLIRKSNINLKSLCHKGLVRYGGKYIFLLGKFL